MTTPDLVIHTLDRGDGAPGRYGLVVSKKERGAVGRNRAKRQLRAAIRLAGGVPSGWDAVLVLKRGRTVDVQVAQKHICQILVGSGSSGSSS